MTENATIQLTECMKTGKIALFPTETVWCLGWSLQNVTLLDKVLSVKPPSPEDPLIILMKDIDMLKDYVVRIHPRIETLLSLHNQPLSIIYPEIKNIPEPYFQHRHQLAFRTTTSKIVQHVFREIPEPIATISAGLRGTLPIDYLQIDAKLGMIADEKIQDVQTDTSEMAPSVIATYDRKGELEFIRE